MKLFKKFFLLMFAAISVLTIAACQYDTQKIVIGEGDWNSNRFYNQITKFILEKGYDEEVEITGVSTPILIQSLTDGTVDVNVETWSDNMPTYASDIKEGNYIELGVNFNDNFQGIYIPKYLQEKYPNLKSIQDLVTFKHLFPDPEITGWDADNDKAVVYGGPSGWNVTQFLSTKFSNETLYPDLVENFEFRPLESTATLNATLTSAYESEEPWVGYNWEPTAIMGKYDMVLLDDDLDYDADTGAGLVPTNDVTIVVTKGFEEAHKEAAEFLSKMQTSATVVNEALAYMEEKDLDAEGAAMWWLENNKDMWSKWVTEEAATKISDALDV